MDATGGNLTRFALLCGQCSCGCPEEARSGRLDQVMAELTAS